MDKTSALPTPDFDFAYYRKMDVPIIDIVVYKQENKPLLYLALLAKSMLRVLDSSLDELYSLDDLFPGAYLLSMSYMFGDLAAVGSDDGRIFVLDFIARKVMCECKVHTLSVLALHANGSRIVCAGRNILLKTRWAALQFTESHSEPVLKLQASRKMLNAPDFVKLVAIDEIPSALAFFQASIWSVLGLTQAPTQAHLYRIEHWSWSLRVNLFHRAGIMNGYYPVDVALSPNGKRYAVVSRKKGPLALTVGEVEKFSTTCDAVIKHSSKWAPGVTVSWSSLEDRVYLTGRDGYVRTIGVANTAEMEKCPVVMKFNEHRGGVKFVRAFDHDDHEVVLSVGNDDVVNVWTRPITHLTLRL